MIVKPFKKIICVIFLIIPNCILPAIYFQDSIKSINITNVVDKKVYYQDGFLYVEGFIGPGKIEVYTILGEKITDISSSELSKFKHPFYLKKANMYIIRVMKNEFIETFKIISH